MSDALAAGLIELGLPTSEGAALGFDRKRLGSRALAQTEDHDGRKAHRGAVEIAHAAISSRRELTLLTQAGSPEELTRKHRRLLSAM